MTDETAKLGHNLSRDQLRSIVNRIEALEEKKAEIATDIKEVYAEGAGHGYDRKALRAIIRERKIDAAEREEHEHWVHTFRVALGMVPESGDA